MRNSSAAAMKGDFGLYEMYRYPPRRGPTMEPMRNPVILTLKAGPLSSEGKESDINAREADPIMLRHPAKSEYSASIATQSLAIAKAPKISGIGRRKAKMTLFLPYLSASHPPGT